MIKHDQLSDDHKIILSELGKKLKQMRKGKEKSYEALAEAIGVSRNTYNLMENGKINFQLSTLLQVLDFHDISVSDFFKDIG